MDEKQKTNIQRIAQGLTPVKGSDPQGTRKISAESTNWLPAVERRATRRLIKKTARLIAKKAEEKKGGRRLYVLAVFAIPILSLSIAGFIILSGRAPVEKKLDRNSDRLRHAHPEPAPGAATPNPDVPDPAAPSRDGKSYRKETYSTGNIKVEVPLENKDRTAPPPPDTPYGAGFRKVPAGMNPDDLRKEKPK